MTTTPTAQPAPADAIIAMMQAALTPIVAPLVAELAASRQTNERQAEQLVSQAETIGVVRTERDQARAERDAARAELEAEKRAHSPGAPDLTPSVPATTTKCPDAAPGPPASTGAVGARGHPAAGGRGRAALGATVSRHVTQVEMDDPPGYFQVTRTGRVHLVRRVIRFVWRSGETHLSIDFWCANIASERQGELLPAMPPDAPACARCQRIRDRRSPRAQA